MDVLESGKDDIIGATILGYSWQERTYFVRLIYSFKDGNLNPLAGDLVVDKLRKDPNYLEERLEAALIYSNQNQIVICPTKCRSQGDIKFVLDIG